MRMRKVGWILAGLAMVAVPESAHVQVSTSPVRSDEHGATRVGQRAADENRPSPVPGQLLKKNLPGNPIRWDLFEKQDAPNQQAPQPWPKTNSGPTAAHGQWCLTDGNEYICMSQQRRECRPVPDRDSRLRCLKDSVR